MASRLRVFYCVCDMGARLMISTTQKRCEKEFLADVGRLNVSRTFEVRQATDQDIRQVHGMGGEIPPILTMLRPGVISGVSK